MIMIENLIIEMREHSVDHPLVQVRITIMTMITIIIMMMIMMMIMMENLIIQIREHPVDHSLVHLLAESFAVQLLCGKLL